MAAEPRGAILQRRLYAGRADALLAAADPSPASLLAEPCGHPDPARAAAIRASAAGPLPARRRSPRGGYHYWRGQPLALPVVVGIKQWPEGIYLTASWSLLALALFTTGIALRERMYRWLGLGVLACALGRVFISDVWKLETLYRILSFMALGIVLLVLGFIYNKYQEKIREWL